MVSRRLGEALPFPTASQRSTAGAKSFAKTPARRAQALSPPLPSSSPSCDPSSASLFLFPALVISATTLTRRYRYVGRRNETDHGRFRKKARISQSRGWLSPKDIVNIHTPAPPAYALHRPASGSPRGSAGERSRFMAGPSIRGTLNLSRLTP